MFDPHPGSQMLSQLDGHEQAASNREVAGSNPAGSSRISPWSNWTGRRSPKPEISGSSPDGDAGWPRCLAVRMPDSQSGDRSSILLEVTSYQVPSSSGKDDGPSSRRRRFESGWDHEFAHVV